MHLVEDIFALTLDLHTLVFANLIEIIGKFAERNGTVLHINNHHHVEEFLNDGLGDVEDVDIL